VGRPSAAAVGSLPSPDGANPSLAPVRAGHCTITTATSTRNLSLLVGNALKNVLLGLSNAVAAVGFVVFGPVQWWAVPPLAPEC
jgi:hypothetical protein